MNKRANFFLAAVILIALFLRVGFVLYVGNRPPVQDEGSYDTLAYNLVKYHEYSLERGVPSLRRSPGYPFFLAGIYKLFGHSYFAARLVQALIGSLTCLLIFFIGRKVKNADVGLISAFIASIYPFFIYYTGYLLAETLLIFFVCLAVYCAIILIDRPCPANLMLSGVILGIMSLIKPVFFVVLPVCMAGFLIKWKHIQKSLFRITILVFFMFAAVLPWGLRNYKQFGVFSVIYAGAGRHLFDKTLILKNEYTGGTELGKSFTDDKQYLKKALKFFQKRPMYIVKHISGNFMNFWSLWPHLDRLDQSQGVSNWIIIVLGFIFFDVVLLFGLLGIWVSFKQWENFIILYGVILAISTVYTLIHAITRYRRPVMPLIIIFAGMGLNYIYKILKKAKQEI